MASASVALAPPPPGHSQSTPNIHLRSQFDDTPRERLELGGMDKSASPENIRTPPKVTVKKEPSSPEPPRHRPSKLNLISASSTNQGIIAQTPRTAKGSLTMHDLGMACLSPGLNVTDNAMREQLERSMNVRNAQRNIIESRLHRNVHDKGDRDQSAGLMTGKGKKRPPSSLSIVPPHHTQFANERIIQSAPLNQSFTVRRQAMLEARQERMANRLPPIADVVFGQDREEERSQLSARQQPQEARAFFPNPLPSPRLAPPEQQPERPREYKSAEEAVASMSMGREDLLPRIVHYGGHQPPTPPSPMMASKTPGLGSSSLKKTTLTIPVAPGPHDIPNNKRRRTGDFDTDRDVSMGSDSEEQDAAEAKRRKKEMFLSLMAQAFDLLHS